jgi:DNA invertase Pin-like site-specific DNA recombinase/archaellum component FlaC
MDGIMYLRKSREDVKYEKETGEDVLEAHRARLTEALTRLGHTWTERAEVKSGDTISGRPKFQQVLYQDIPSGKQFISVTEIPRLGRGKMKVAGEIYETIIEYNTFIITPNKTYDPTNPADLRQIRFELFMSREEYENTKERLWNGRHYRATQGFAGNYIVTLGFRQSRGKVEIIPEEAALVEEIFNLRSEGYSYQEIADYLNSRGLKSKRGTVYHHSTVKRILHNPRYIGLARWMGKLYKAKHPAIINNELWEKVQDVNKERTHTRRESKDDSPYLVDLYCHECGRRMYGEINHPWKMSSKGEKLVYTRAIYICRGRKNERIRQGGPKCTHQINQSIVHEKVFEELKKIVYDTSIFAELAKEREARHGGSAEHLEAQLENLNKQIKLKNEFLSRLENDYESGSITGLLYSKHVEKTSREISAMETRIKKLSSEISKSKVKINTPDEIKSIIQTFIENWDSYPNKSKKIIIRSFLPRIEVDKQKTFYIARSLPFSIPK